MRGIYDFVLLEVYCFSEDCNRSALEHLEFNQGGWCEGHLGDYLHTLGFFRVVQEYLAVWWENIVWLLKWHLWNRWFWDEEVFAQRSKERVLRPGECPVAENWPSKCKFPVEKEVEDEDY